MSTDDAGLSLIYNCARPVKLEISSFGHLEYIFIFALLTTMVKVDGEVDLYIIKLLRDYDKVFSSVDNK